MGFSPPDVDRMGLWQFTAALHGYQIANGQKARPGSDISDERLAQMGIEGFV
jgi:hypothetical protein